MGGAEAEWLEDEVRCGRHQKDVGEQDGTSEDATLDQDERDDDRPERSIGNEPDLTAQHRDDEAGDEQPEEDPVGFEGLLSEVELVPESTPSVAMTASSFASEAYVANVEAGAGGTRPVSSAVAPTVPFWRNSTDVASRSSHIALDEIK
ncbi:hypothetical protein [Natronolimnohabitans innermongolicus]|uniref:hypothetical protein n=1 Tax=Natronolimnohabitans innermongolicus TaxID=253107 RepID=UPI00126880DF|nr:hypothetical protein [Natronolimnohabitans innermongolicus]